MTHQLSIFDLRAGVHGRDMGIIQIINSCETFIDTARGVARRLAIRHGLVTSDDVREVLSQYGVYAPHPNAYGAIFKSREWIHVGYTQSRIPSNHARTIKTWRLRKSANRDDYLVAA